MAKRDHETESVIEQMRNLRSDYDASKKTRFKRTRTGVVSQGSGADYHYRTWHSYASIMETARDLFRNHMLIGQGIRRLVANILGSGFTLDVKSGDKSLDAELKARWDAWAESPNADLAGEQCFHGLERLALQQVIVDGDVVPLPTESGAVQLVEAHRLRTPTNTSRNVVHGVLLDEATRRRDEYWITNEDISPMAPLARVGDVTRYPTRYTDDLTGAEERQILHLYMPDRSSQTRGVTALVPAIDNAGMGDDLAFAQLVKAQMSACVTILRELAAETQYPQALGDGSGQETETEQRPNGTVRTVAGWQPGMEIFGYPGEKLTGFSPNVPNAEFFQHMMFIISIVAVNLDLPIAVFMLDPSNTNFSGYRGAMNQARERFKVIQHWLAQSFHSPLYRWKVRQFAAEDAALRTAIERSLRDKKAANPFRHVWHAQEWPYIEPTQDALGDVIQESNLLSSPRRLRARRGIDYEQLVGEIVEDRELLIVTAHKKAEDLNRRFDLGLTWRDLVHWPLPDGMNLSVSADGQKPKQKPAPATPKEEEQPNGQPANRIAALTGVNGHAN